MKKFVFAKMLINVLLKVCTKNIDSINKRLNPKKNTVPYFVPF